MHPLRPAVVSSYLVLRELSGGRSAPEEEELAMDIEGWQADEGEMKVEVTEAVGMKAVAKEGVEEIENLTICDS